jgi:uncharacterized protein YndB with AHSA1/START domain
MANSPAIAPEHEGMTGTQDDGRAFIRFERQLRHPVERVWAALVEPEQIIEWLCWRVHIEPRVGGQYTMWLGEAGGEKPEEVGRITVFEPPRVLEADGADGGTLRWELRPDGAGCVLTFTDMRPLGERASNSVLAGWHLRMELLPEALDGRPTDWVALDATRTEHGSIARIEEIYWHYRNQAR